MHMKDEIAITGSPKQLNMSDLVWFNYNVRFYVFVEGGPQIWL